MILPGLEDAFAYAQTVHAAQRKKGTEIPFLYHPLAVASLVLKYGGGPDQVRAALLHDAVEQDDEASIARRFGTETARLVFAFADPVFSSGDGAPGWTEKKKAYLGKLRMLDVDALLVIACEELHDGTEVLHDLRYQGPVVWKRYTAHSMEVFWYFRELLQLLHEKLNEPRYRALVSEFAAMVRAMKGIIMEGDPG